MATVDELQTAIANAADEAKQLSDDALLGVDRAIGSAEAAASGVVGIDYSPNPNPVDVAPGNVIPPDIPTGDFTVEVKDAFDYAFSAFNQDVQPQILNYLETFFPDIAQAVKTNSDQWIADTIVNGRYVPIDVENAMWNRARDREVGDTLRAEQAAINAGASRGFSSPQGVENNAVFVLQEELSKKLTTINRDITIKAFDVANENTKFAIEQAVRLRTAFVAALGDFIKVAMAQPNQAVDYAKLILSAKTGLYDSAVRLYSARIDGERVRSSTLLENRNQDLRTLEIDSHDFDTFAKAAVDRARLQADVALKAADTLAQIAAAAQATRNTMTSVNGGV